MGLDYLIFNLNRVEPISHDLRDIFMSFLSGKLGSAKFSHPIKTMHCMDIFGLHTSKVPLSAFFRVSILR
ncbi:hypothetical protein W01_13910 [Candidatus Nitrotoga sp. AM1P]|nr:hypothetical protein W01_13910 [Candidatus Nitrotoga sp. AM1P]